MNNNTVQEELQRVADAVALVRRYHTTGEGRDEIVRQHQSTSDNLRRRIAAYDR